MTQANFIPPQGGSCQLEAIAIQENDPKLFPLAVVERYRGGKQIHARKLLIKENKGELDSQRKDKREKYIDQLRLWVEPLEGVPSLGRVNGFGLTLYGSREPSEDGRYIATHWFTAVFLPIWPFGAYLVKQVGGGFASRAFEFYGKTPIPPLAIAMRRAVVGAGLAFLAVLGMQFHHKSTHNRAFAVNGFDVPMTVRIGEEERIVPAFSALEFAEIPSEKTAITARVRKDSAPMEQIEEDLSSHAGKLFLYNIRGRGLISHFSIVYGPGEPNNSGRVFAGESSVYLDEVDYPFQQPPETKYVENGRRVENTVLRLERKMDFGVLSIVNAVSNTVPREKLLAMVNAELDVHPESEWAIMAGLQLQPNADSTQGFLKSCLSRKPDSVAIHRYIQSPREKTDRKGLIQEYRELHEKNPDSANYQYLLARILHPSAEEAITLLEKAVELDPKLAYAYVSLAHRKALAGEFEAAWTFWEKFASFSSEYRHLSFMDRLRIPRLLGESIDGARTKNLLAREAGPKTRGFLIKVRLEAEKTKSMPQTLLKTLEGDFPDRKIPMTILADTALAATDLESLKRYVAQMLLTEGKETQSVYKLYLGLSASSDEKVLREAAESLKSQLETLPKTPRLLFALATHLLDMQEKESAVNAVRAADFDYGEPDRFFTPGADLTSRSFVEDCLKACFLEDQATGYFVAAKLLEKRAMEGDEASRQAMRTYLERMRKLSIPGELPIPPSL